MKGIRNKPQIRRSDRIEGEKIILDGRGQFPKKVIIQEPGKSKEYRLVRTIKGGYLLT